MTSRDIRKIVVCFTLMISIPIILSGFCDLDEYYCEGTDRCIDSEYVCDNDNDCGDNSDESEAACSRNHFMEAITFIPMTVTDSGDCENSQVPCSEQSGSKCIHRDWVCDGEWDCSHGSDERDCSQPSPTTNQHTSTTPAPPITRRPFVNILSTHSSQQRCTNSQFRCPEKCINKSWACDGDKDCNDGSDESPQICEGGSSSTNRRTSTVRSGATSTVAPIDTTTRVDSLTTNRNSESNSADEKSSEDCDSQPSSSISFTLWNWIQCALFVVGIICIIAIVVIVCKKRKSRSAGLNSRSMDDRCQAVSFLNSNIVPECQLVLVGTPVQVQPTVVQSAPTTDQPPPYDTQSSPNPTQMPNLAKGDLL